MLQKNVMIFIISFVKIGPSNVVDSNNAFLCFIVLSLSFWGQLKSKPFLTESMNSLNFKATILMMVSIFFGLFCTLSQDTNIQIICFTVLVIANVYFFSIFIKEYLLLKIVLLDEKSFIIVFLKKHNLFTKRIYIFFCLLYILFLIDQNEIKASIAAVQNVWMRGSPVLKSSTLKKKEGSIYPKGTQEFMRLNLESQIDTLAPTQKNMSIMKEEVKDEENKENRENKEEENKDNPETILTKKFEENFEGINEESIQLAIKKYHISEKEILSKNLLDIEITLEKNERCKNMISMSLKITNSSNCNIIFENISFESSEG